MLRFIDRQSATACFPAVMFSDGSSSCSLHVSCMLHAANLSFIGSQTRPSNLLYESICELQYRSDESPRDSSYEILIGDTIGFLYG